MIYSIKILNYNFDKDYDNVRLFENKDAQSRFFDNIHSFNFDYVFKWVCMGSVLV